MNTTVLTSYSFCLDIEGRGGGVEGFEEPPVVIQSADFAAKKCHLYRGKQKNRSPGSAPAITYLNLWRGVTIVSTCYQTCPYYLKYRVSQSVSQSENRPHVEHNWKKRIATKASFYYRVYKRRDNRFGHWHTSVVLLDSCMYVLLRYSSYYSLQSPWSWWNVHGVFRP